jgi:hypothetical protein
MTERGITEGFSRYLTHCGPVLPAWQRSLNDRLFSCVAVEDAWMARLREGECVEWETGPVRPFDEAGRVCVCIPMAMGLGEAEYMPSGELLLSIGNELVMEFHAVKYSTLWRREEARFYYEVKRKVTRPETATAGMGYLLLPARFSRRAGQSLHLRLHNRKRSYMRKHNSRVSDRWVRIDGRPNVEGSAFLDWGLAAVQDEPERASWDGRQLYFGDLHSHSGRIESLYRRGEREFLRGGNCGIGEPNEWYHYAKHISRLDFYSLTDHHRTTEERLTCGMTEADWAYRLEMVRKWDAPDFAPIPGIELVKRDAGHWNAYFREAVPVYPPPEELPFPEVQRILHERYREGTVMLVPHQTSTYCCRPINWDLYDPALSPIVEIYSHWGSDEYFGNPLQCREVDVNPHCFVDVALKRGHRMGFIGSTDEHGGAPGDGVTFLNPLGAGLACVWAPELNRESIFDALHDRWCYATTGGRIVLKFTVNGRAMGREAASGEGARVIRLEAEAPEHIEEVVLLKNSDEWAVENGRMATGQWEWVDETSPGETADYYYPRVVLADGETAWGSPVWVE